MKPKNSTIARTIILALALLNSVLSQFGIEIINIPDEAVDSLIDSVFLILSAVSAWWKNNSFTYEAQMADEYIKMATEKCLEEIKEYSITVSLYFDFAE